MSFGGRPLDSRHDRPPGISFRSNRLITSANDENLKEKLARSKSESNQKRSGMTEAEKVELAVLRQLKRTKADNQDQADLRELKKLRAEYALSGASAPQGVSLFHLHQRARV
jgi:hypothetical protein